MKRILLVFMLIGGFYTSVANNRFINTLVGEEGIRLETINEYAFFILKVDSNFVDYGDRVELVFGFSHKSKLYNISGKDIYTFTNPNEWWC